MVLLKRKLYLSKDPEGVSFTYFSIFKGGGGGGGGFGATNFPEGVGVQMLISIETHITCDFPRGIQTPYLPSGSALVLERKA